MEKASPPPLPDDIFHITGRRPHFIRTLTRFTISNLYYFTVLKLSDCLATLDYGSIKCSPPPLG